MNHPSEFDKMAAGQPRDTWGPRPEIPQRIWPEDYAYRARGNVAHAVAKEAALTSSDRSALDQSLDRLCETQAETLGLACQLTDRLASVLGVEPEDSGRVAAPASGVRLLDRLDALNEHGHTINAGLRSLLRRLVL